MLFVSVLQLFKRKQGNDLEIKSRTAGLTSINVSCVKEFSWYIYTKMFQRIILDNKIQVMTGTYVFPGAKDIKQGSGENK